MELIEETIVNNHQIKYYNGLDIEAILNHPKDGSKGMMVVFFHSIKNEKLKHQRNSLIQGILDMEKVQPFDSIISNIDNSYLILYETHGYTDLLYKVIKNKLESIKDYNFESTKVLWSK